MNEILTCPKCRGTMRTHLRQGVHVEQCDMCRGIFLDYGELEAINRLGGGAPPAPTPHAHPPQVPPMGHHPAWGHPPQAWGHPQHHHHHGHHHGFARMFFSS